MPIRISSNIPVTGGTDPIIREYTTNSTWTKPSTSNFWGVMVVCIGAGSGGASGRRGSTVRTGGGGGGGGSLVYRVIRASQLTNATYSVTIGTGSTGGALVNTNDTNGNGSTAAGDTSFGSLVIAKGAGGAGDSSHTTEGQGGDSTSCTPSRQPFSLSGTNGGAGGGASGFIFGGASATAGFSGAARACAGGGGGGNIEGRGNTPYGGGNGSSVFDGNTESAAPSGGTVAGDRNGGNGVDNIVNNILLDIDNSVTVGPGSGGGGGACGDTAGTIAGGNGGNGGKCAGGGGGGASTNGANSGSGGNGGNGLCFVVEFYGA